MADETQQVQQPTLEDRLTKVENDLKELALAAAQPVVSSVETRVAQLEAELEKAGIRIPAPEPEPVEGQQAEAVKEPAPVVTG